MSEEIKSTTETTTETSNGVNDSHDSQIMGVSVRAWLVLILVGTVCGLAVSYAVTDIVLSVALKTLPTFEVKEPLYSIVIAAVAYYFGQSQRKQSQ